MNEIKQLLDSKRKELDRIQKQVDSLELAWSLLQSESKGLPGGIQSQPSMAVAVLEAAGEPLHVSKIVSEMNNRYQLNVNKNSMSAILYRYADRGKHFYKDTKHPNTYGLLHWK